MSHGFEENKGSGQFEILRDIALSASAGANLSETAESALRSASALVGLSAGTLILWDQKETPILAVSHSETEQERKVLQELEGDLFASLRKKRKLVAAYISFGGEAPFSSFTLPLKKRENIFGAVIGIQPGRGSLVREDVFLEALAASLSLAVMAGREPSAEEIKAQIKKERLGTIMETAATVSHEINNPLTAVLGNVQLMLLKREGLSEDAIKKLKVIEESALRIKDVTQKLMNITRDKVTDYTEGVKMIDLTEEDTASS